MSRGRLLTAILVLAGFAVLAVGVGSWAVLTRTGGSSASEIAFAVNYAGRGPTGGAIVLMNTEGKTLATLFSGRQGENVGGPAWTPDGKALIFGHSTGEEPSQLFGIDADGRNLQQLTHVTESGAFIPVEWSPTQDSLLVRDFLAPTIDNYFRYDPKTKEIQPVAPKGTFIVSADWLGETSDVIGVHWTDPFTRVGSAVVVSPDGTMRTLVPRTKDVTAVAGSPDGELAAVTTQSGVILLPRTLTRTNSTLWLGTTKGGPFRKLGPGRNPAWSPDGKYLAYSCGPDRFYRVCIVDRDGKKVREIRVRGFSYGWPVPLWSPDSSKVAFPIRSEFDTQVFFVAPVSGGQPKSVGRHEVAKYQTLGSWSPDGRTLVVLASADAGATYAAIASSPSAESKLTPLTTLDQTVGLPAWRPS